MRRGIMLIALLSFLSCTEEKSAKLEIIQEPKQVEVGINHTIETFMILRSIANEDPLFQYRDSTYLGKPIMYEARRAFKDYKAHPAVRQTQKMLEATSSTGDLILQGLLYFEELPSTSLKYEVSSEEWKNRKDSLISYVKSLHQFYEDAKVGEFISSQSDFYRGAISEAESFLDDDLIPTMEFYFGMENHAYRMILIPNSPFGMGFGASVSSEQGDIFYQIISPSNELEWSASATYTTYGYSGEGAEGYYRDLVVHEFCHPFITPFIETEKMKNEIAKSDSLFIPALDSIMSDQGYGSWWAFVNEHLVRLGELRVARTMNIEDLEAMRKYIIEENGFILLPDAEELVLKYENNRSQFETFRDFIPTLLEQLESFNKSEINTKLEKREKENVQ